MMNEKGIHYTFGASSARSDNTTRTINQEVYASVDIDFLREVVNNLVENAIKYTASGGGIWINVRGDGDRVLINVTDTGIGISPDDLKHIFQKFYRADNSQTRTVGGTGLGLYLVKQRVEAMGGKVWAESSFGEGSTFYLSFPRITAEEYQRRKQIASNIEAMNINSVNNNTLNQPNDVTPTSSETPTTQDTQANQAVPGVQTAQLAPTAPEIKTTQVAPESSISSTAPINPITSQPVIQQQYQPMAQPIYATQAVQTGQPQAVQAPMMQPHDAQPQPGQIPIVQPQTIQPQTMQPQSTQPTVLQQSVNNNQKLPINN